MMALTLQAAFQLGNVADGVLPSAFLVGLLIASVVFSELTQHFNAFRMIGTLLRKPCTSYYVSYLGASKTSVC